MNIRSSRGGASPQNGEKWLRTVRQARTHTAITFLRIEEACSECVCAYVSCIFRDSFRARKGAQLRPSFDRKLR